MSEPEWLEMEAIEVLHDVSLSLHGGAAGIRDQGLLASALQRAISRFLHDDVDDLAVLAATYAAAMSGNHPFVDGDKRAAFQAMTLFLRINGRKLFVDQGESTAIIYALAAGELDVERLAEWLRRNTQAV